MKLELTEQEINYIYSLLRKRPHEESDAIIQKLLQQVNSKQEADNKEE